MYDIFAFKYWMKMIWLNINSLSVAFHRPFPNTTFGRRHKHSGYRRWIFFHHVYSPLHFGNFILNIFHFIFRILNYFKKSFIKYWSTFKGPQLRLRNTPPKYVIYVSAPIHTIHGDVYCERQNICIQTNHTLDFCIWHERLLISLDQNTGTI